MGATEQERRQVWDAQRKLLADADRYALTDRRISEARDTVDRRIVLVHLLLGAVVFALLVVGSALSSWWVFGVGIAAALLFLVWTFFAAGLLMEHIEQRRRERWGYR